MELFLVITSLPPDHQAVERGLQCRENRKRGFCSVVLFFFYSFSCCKFQVFIIFFNVTCLKEHFSIESSLRLERTLLLSDSEKAQKSFRALGNSEQDLVL